MQAALGGTTDAFVAKIHAGGTALDYSTYLGGSGNDAAFGLTLDPSKNAYVTGMTASSRLPQHQWCFRHSDRNQ